MLDKIQEYTTKNNENAETVIIEINNIKLEIKDDYKKTLDNIASYLERDDVRSLNTNSIILYENLWNDVEIILNAPNKKEIYESWNYGTACIEKALLFLFMTTALKNETLFHFLMVMHLYMQRKN